MGTNSGLPHARQGRLAVRFHRAFVLPFLLAAIHQSACDDRGAPGDTCHKKTDAQCLDERTELYCQDGALVAGRCAGPKGCRETDHALFCDFSENRAGEACAVADEGNAQCRPSRTERIRCTGGEYAVEHCRGDRGCHTKDGKVLCDQSIGKVGERCSGRTHACSVDRESLLECVGGVFEQKAPCPGESGCNIDKGAVQCDQRTTPTRP